MMMNILKKMLLGNNEGSKYCLEMLNGHGNELLEILNKMNGFYLYDSLIHGRNHSERVLLFSFLLAKHYNLSKTESMILMDAAKPSLEKAEPSRPPTTVLHQCLNV